MSNSISFTGKLGKDAELKQVGSSDLLEFNVANNIGFGDKRVTLWFKCTIWGKQATTLEQYLKKGTGVFINGEFNARTYNNKDGVEKTSLEVRVNSVDLLGGKKEESDEYSPAKATAKSVKAAPEEDGSDMPF